MTHRCWTLRRLGRAGALVSALIMGAFASAPAFAQDAAKFPVELNRLEQDAGVCRVYTPKDFDLTRIMSEIVDVVSEAHAS